MIQTNFQKVFSFIISKTSCCFTSYVWDFNCIFNFNFQKKGTVFVESDIALFEAFAIFCGIGIHNTKMLEGACKLMAKQKVALDCLSYHAAANDDDTNKLAASEIPKAEEFKLDR